MTARQTPPEGAGAPPPAAGDDHPPATAKKNQKRVALYLRVSTDRQTTDNQERELRALADRAGWNIVAVYKDEGISGTKGREKRPALNKMMQDAVRREFDLVAAWSVDRIFRSVQHMAALMNDLRSIGIDVFLHKQGVDTSSSSGRMVMNVFASIAEWERELIVDRVKSGMARARAAGKQLGRTPVPEAVRQAIREELARGTGINKTARIHGVGVLTVQNIKKEMANG